MKHKLHHYIGMYLTLIYMCFVLFKQAADTRIIIFICALAIITAVFTVGHWIVDNLAEIQKDIKKQKGETKNDAI